MKLKKRSLVLLIGPIGCGKSTFASKYFGSHIVSADSIREMISGDAGNQNVSRDAFDIMNLLIDAKMRHDFPIIVDNLNHRPSSRRDLLRLADKYGYAKIGVVFDETDLATCQSQNAFRSRVVPREIVEKQYNAFRENLKFLGAEGFDLLLHAKEVKEPFEFDNNSEPASAGENVDKAIIIGDVHGCLPELLTLLSKIESEGLGDHKVIFVGDLADRGPSNAGVLDLVADMIADGRALSALGNHDDKLRRYLKGSNVKLGHGLEKTVNQIENHMDSKNLKEKLLKMLGGLPYYLTLDGGKLIVCHAGIEDRMIGQSDNGVLRSFCLFGKTTGNKDENGFPERIDWAAERVVTENSPLIVYGHSVQESGLPYQINKTINVDTGCCFNGNLTGYVYPENRFISVKAFSEYEKYKNRQ